VTACPAAVGWKRPLLGPGLLAAVLCLLAVPTRADLWVTGYYPGWEQGSMPASNIDFTTLTHVIHFALVVNPDGTLDSGTFSITPVNSAEVISRAHAAGREALICVGGASSQAGFQGATSSGHLSAFISNLTNFMATRGYDGVDLDWEPLAASDTAQYTNLVNGLRSALDAFPQDKLLTAAVTAYPPYGDPATEEYAMFAALQDRFDQLNIMTYDLAGPWPGWVTWFNSPIYDGGYHFPGSGGLVPSVDGAVNNFLVNGVAAAKLGIGIAFYGFVWTGGSGVWVPRQSWPADNPPTASQQSYFAILSGYYRSNVYHWDDSAQAAWLGVTNPVSTDDLFVSYDDARACQAKISYARNHGLGGVMIWELAQDYFAAQPAGQRNPLFQSIKDGLATPGLTVIRPGAEGIDLNFTGLPLGSYRVQWTSRLPATAWNTLALTNVTGTGGVLQVADPAAPAQAQRFYRVQSPP
jgi:chitinase